MRIFSSAAWRLQQASRMTPAWSWISVLSSLRECYDEPQKSPIPQAVSFVSQVLKRTLGFDDPLAAAGRSLQSFAIDNRHLAAPAVGI